MKNKKRAFLVLVASAALFLSISSQVGAFYENKNTNSLQWFPALAADNESIYVVWADERNGNYTRIMNNLPHKSGDIYLSRGSFQDGWFFDKNIRINEIKGSTGHGSPSIALDSDSLYVLWEDDRFGFEELYFAYSPKNEVEFSKDTPVIAKPGSQVLPSIAVLNRTVYVTMMNKKTLDIEFAEGHAFNGVYGFDKPVRVNDDPQGWHYAPSLAVDDERNVCIAWLDARNNNYDIYFSHGTKEEGRWSFGENVRVNDHANASQYTPSIAFDNGSAYVVWYDDRSGDFDIYFARGSLQNNGWEFDRSVRVNDDAKGDQMHPVIAASDGKIFAAWEDGREGSSNIYFSNGILENGSFRFGRNVRVNEAGGNHLTPQIKVNSGNVYLVWQAEINDGGDILFSHGKYDGKTWEFGRNIKVNDDVTSSFVKPDNVFLGLILSMVIVSIIIVSFLKRKNEK